MFYISSESITNLCARYEERVLYRAITSTSSNYLISFFNAPSIVSYLKTSPPALINGSTIQNWRHTQTQSFCILISNKISMNKTKEKHKEYEEGFNENEKQNLPNQTQWHTNETIQFIFFKVKKSQKVMLICGISVTWFLLGGRRSVSGRAAFLLGFELGVCTAHTFMKRPIKSTNPTPIRSTPHQCFWK